METNNKMREALVKVLNAIKHLSQIHNDNLPEDVRATLGRMAFDANEALAEPVRNCDVGTADEQSERCDKFCYMHNCKSDCPLSKADSCELAWAQMPYKKGENNGNEENNGNGKNDENV